MCSVSLHRVSLDCFAVRSCAPPAFRAGRLSSSRHSSALARQHDAPPTDTRVEAEASGTNPNADQPMFSTLQDVVAPSTLKALTKGPFRLVHMSPVQAAVLPLLPGLVQRDESSTEEDTRTDLMVKARTGTGKTLAFLVPAVEARVNALRAHAETVAKDTMSSNKTTIERAVTRYAKENVGALIISPTRELATQIANEAIKLTQHHSGFEVRLFVGGLSKRSQTREWNVGRRDIVVATPGRLRDFMENERGFTDALKTTEMVRFTF